MTTTTEWTEADADEARREGWDIFDCDGSDNGPWQIQRLDDPEAWVELLGVLPPTFETDTDAWDHVLDKMVEGSSLHQKALDFIAENNLDEWNAILRHVDPNHPGLSS